MHDFKAVLPGRPRDSDISARRGKSLHEPRRQHGSRHPSGKPDHLTGALRTNADIFSEQCLDQVPGIHVPVRISRIVCTTKTMDHLQIFRFTAVRKIPGKTDTVEAFGKDVL